MVHEVHVGLAWLDNKVLGMFDYELTCDYHMTGHVTINRSCDIALHPINHRVARS